MPASEETGGDGGLNEVGGRRRRLCVVLQFCFSFTSGASDPPLIKLTGFIQCDVWTSQSGAQSVTLKLT